MDFDIFRVSFLAFIQGLTEFLPISSSAHLILPSAILGWDDQGLAFDVAVHLGTLTAVILYFRKDIISIIVGWSKHITGGVPSSESRLGWMLIVATLPVVIAGVLLKDVVDQQFRTVTVIACSTIVFGVALFFADVRSKCSIQLNALSWKSCLLIGFAQVIALIPGTSRSGITMTAALLCNLDRDSASRFSFLLSIPVIAGAALLLGLDLLEAPTVNWGELIYAMLLAAVVAYLCIHYFLKTITAMGFLPFVIYRIVLGLGLFIFFM